MRSFFEYRSNSARTEEEELANLLVLCAAKGLNVTPEMQAKLAKAVKRQKELEKEDV